MKLNLNEKILWEGKPKQGIFLTSRDIFLIPLSIVWCGFAVFWTLSARHEGTPGFFTIWGTMFVCFGLYAVFGRFIHDSILRSKCSYYVSNERIIIVKIRSEVSNPINQWACLELEKAIDGTGTIRFGHLGNLYGSSGFGFWVPSLTNCPQFYRIGNSDQVMGIINSLAKKNNHGMSGSIDA